MRVVEEENKHCSYNWQSLGDGGRKIDRQPRKRQANVGRGGAERLMKRVGGGQNDGRMRLEEDRGGHSHDGLKWSMISMGNRGGWRKWKRGSSSSS